MQLSLTGMKIKVLGSLFQHQVAKQYSLILVTTVKVIANHSKDWKFNISLPMMQKAGCVQ